AAAVTQEVEISAIGRPSRTPVTVNVLRYRNRMAIGRHRPYVCRAWPPSGVRHIGQTEAMRRPIRPGAVGFTHVLRTAASQIYPQHPAVPPSITETSHVFRRAHDLLSIGRPGSVMAILTENPARRLSRRAHHVESLHLGSKRPAESNL